MKNKIRMWALRKLNGVPRELTLKDNAVIVKHVNDKRWLMSQLRVDRIIDCVDNDYIIDRDKVLTKIQRQTRKPLGWANAVFGEKVASNFLERCARFAEESLELVQAGGLSKCEVLKLVDHVYSKQHGLFCVELGQVMLQLEMLAEVTDNRLDNLADLEYNSLLAKESQYFTERQNSKAKKGLGMWCDE